MTSTYVLILSFDSSSINTVCYETEKTKTFLSIPSRVTVFFHYPSYISKIKFYTKVNCASLKERKKNSCLRRAERSFRNDVLTMFTAEH